MTKRLLVILFVIIGYSSLFSINKVYKLKYDNTHTFVIKLSSNNLYSIDFTTRHYSDLLIRKVISNGHYKIASSLIKMTDDWSNYSMHFKIEGSKLIPVKSFACFSNRIFEYVGPDIERISHEKKIKLDGTQRKLYPIKKIDFGVYKCQTEELKCELILKPNNKYEYKLDDCVLSEGFYCTTNNIIRLKDKILDHSFNFIIEGNYIIDNFQIIGTRLMK